MDNVPLEEHLRQKAIQLYKIKWPVSEIIKELNRSRSWFYGSSGKSMGKIKRSYC